MTSFEIYNADCTEMIYYASAAEFVDYSATHTLRRISTRTEGDFTIYAFAIVEDTDAVRTYWIDNSTGAVYTRRERDFILETKYDFDDWTSALEVYDYFTPICISVN